MTPQQSETLRIIQALSIAAHEKTGISTCLSVYTTHRQSDEAPLTIHASVTIMPGDDKPWSMKGSTSQYLNDGENNLEGLRDKLAAWIVANSKQEVA